jgi:hypothetical protein
MEGTEALARKYIAEAVVRDWNLARDTARFSTDPSLALQASIRARIARVTELFLLPKFVS